MARNKGDVIAQRKELFPDTRDQLLVITAGEISAADRTLEEHISDPGDLLWLIEEYDMTRCVPRTVDHMEFLLANSHYISLLQPTVRKKRISRGKTRHLAGLREPLQPELVFAVRALNWHLQLPAQNIRCGTVVQMGVRENNFFDAGIHLLDSGQDALYISTGIHYCRPAGILTFDDGTVLLVGSYRNDRTLDGHKSRLISRSDLMTVPPA